MIEAFIFDMDGLLIDSEPYWDEARKMLIRDCGSIWEWTPVDQAFVMGRNTSQWAGYMVERFHLGLSPEEVEAEIIANMEKLYRRKVPFLPGAIEVVAAAADCEHLRSCLASGSPWRLIETVTENPYLQGKFEAILSGDQFDRGKPAPDIYLAAAGLLGIVPENCLCFEDSGNGILAGKAAGMKVVAVQDQRFSPASELLAEADVVLGSLLEFSLETVTHL